MNSDEKLVLLVDDNEDDVFFTKRAFVKSNIANRVAVAKDGEEALDFLFARGSYSGRDLTDMPVLTLLDLKMPRVDGLQVLKAMRAHPRTKCLPVVILTASKEETDIARSYVEGCNAYMTKPVDFSQLSRAIRELGLFWLVLNEPPLPVP